jgi:hypothetical protein
MTMPATPSGRPRLVRRNSIRHSWATREWKNVGQQLGSCQRALNWWIGDWLAYGQAEYKDCIHGNRLPNGILRFASKLLGLDEGTLRNYKVGLFSRQLVIAQ